MSNEFENKVLAFIRSEALLANRSAILVAVSGGADSMALLAALKHLGESRAIDASLVVGHVNHRLRAAASDDDEAFVKDAAARWGYDCLVRSVDVRNHARTARLSIETAARRLRLDALIQMAKGAHCTAIATAHHADDNAETVVHRLLRGTGLRGLAGIRPARTLHGDAGPMTFVSPLLCVTRPEILAYCADRNVEWRHDHTNDDCTHTRNRIRHALLPALRRNAGPDLDRQLQLLSTAARKLVSQTEAKADNVYGTALLEERVNRIVLNRRIIASQPDPLAVEAIRRALMQIHVGLRDMSERSYLAVMQQARRGRPSTLALPGGAHAFVCKDCLCIEKTDRAENKTAPANSIQLTIDGATTFGTMTFETALLDASACDLQRLKEVKDPCTEFFDYDKIAPPLIVRARRPGDRFHPFGAPADKKVGKFLTAARIKAECRTQVLIVADADKIIWVAPVRPCEQTRITAGTRTVLRLSLKGPCPPGPPA